MIQTKVPKRPPVLDRFLAFLILRLEEKEGFVMFDNPACVYCGSSNVIKYGKRETKDGEIQIYKCKSCKRYFSDNRYKPNLKEIMIKTSIHLYSLGQSYRKIARFFREDLGFEVSHVTVRNWVKMYANPN